MLDNPSGPNDMSEESIESIGSLFYGNDSEPSVPTEEPSSEVVTETETESAETDDASVSNDQDVDADEDGDGEEVLVFDEPNDFVKYEHDEESGLYEFKADGKKVKANIEKLISNYGQVQNYTKDKMKLADERKGVFDEHKAKELETVRAEATKYQELSSKLESLMQDQEKEINWEELREYDTPEFLKQKELKSNREKALADAKAEFQERQQESRKQVVESEVSKLREAMPEWADEKVLAHDMTMINDAFDKMGFSKQEVTNIVDHRAYKVMLMAAKYMKASEKAAAAKEVKKVPRTVKGQQNKQPETEDMSLGQILYGK